MYLSFLNRKEKIVFLSLAYHVAQLDQVVTDEEIKLIESYKKELGELITEEELISNMNHLLELLSEVTLQNKKIIVFELIGLSLSDNNFDESERNFISKLCKDFELDLDYMVQCETLVLDYLNLQNRINSTVLV